MLKHRIATAAILIPLVLFLILYPHTLPFIIFAVVLTAIAAWEWSGLVGFKNIFMRALYSLVITSCIYFLMYIPIVFVLLFGLAHWLIAFGFIIRYPGATELWARGKSMRILWGFWVLLPLFAGIVASSKEVRVCPVVVFVIAVGADRILLPAADLSVLC